LAALAANMGAAVARAVARAYMARHNAGGAWCPRSTQVELARQPARGRLRCRLATPACHGRHRAQAKRRDTRHTRAHCSTIEQGLFTMQYVFVYGTLRAGEINDIGKAAARNALDTPVLVGEATLRGRLFDFGNYPGFVPDDKGIHVKGDVYQVDDRLVSVLDEIEQVYPGEAGLFMQHTASVAVDGTTFDCLYYPVQADAVRGLPEIGSGDWIAHRRSRK
jgi:gamma-glutamylcyclotransferase (GGCT)/AIG2-like uncharacterized protein YtfP